MGLQMMQGRRGEMYKPVALVTGVNKGNGFQTSRAPCVPRRGRSDGHIFKRETSATLVM